MSDHDHTPVPPPNDSCSAAISAPAAAPPLSPGVSDRACPDPALRDEGSGAKPRLPGVCHHRMESGYYCGSPALHDRRYCWSHLRLRGQRIRMARAIARKLPYRFDLPALDDLYAVQSAVEHVTRALAAGLMKRDDATGVLWGLQQSAILHRALAEMRMSAGATPLPASAPPFSPGFGERAADNQRLLVEEYPEFEAEFGLSAGIDVSQPAHLLFPPPEDQWRIPTTARDPKTSPWCHRQPGKHWTREEIEREELEKKARTMGEKEYLRQQQQLDGRIARQLHKVEEQACQAEADRRNRALQERELQFGSMDEGERQAYNLGIFRAMEAVQEEEEERERWRQEYAPKAS